MNHTIIAHQTKHSSPSHRARTNGAAASRLVKTTLLALSLGAGALIACSAHAQSATAITPDDLVRRTQELFDAAATGDRTPWQKYFADDCLFFDEKGRNMDKPALIADLAPLPPGYSGTIKIAKHESRIIGDTAILSYDLDETEIVFGQHLTARYHGTDTWMQRHGVWQIIASQMLRYYEDPPAGKANPATLPDFVGKYALGPTRTVDVATSDGKLYFLRPGANREELIPEAGDIFFRKGVEGRSVFRRNAAGKIDAYISRRNNEDIVWMKVN